MKNKIFMPLIIITIISMCSFIINGCKTAEEETLTIENGTASGITLISVEEVFDVIENNEDYFILDVRTQEEYDEGHIEGAMNIPVDKLENRLDELPEDKPIIVYCRSGIRSNNASNILIENGFTRVYDMDGGILEWIDKGYPVVLYGETTAEGENSSEVISISVDDSYEHYGDEDYIFLDVRSLSEYESGHIEGALHIPVSELEDRLDELTKDKHIIAYCNGSGCERSGRAAIILVNNGFSHVYDMAGLGVIEWEQKGYPIEK